MKGETKYARAGDIYIAYQVVGDGPVDLVFLPNWFSNIELFWQNPDVSGWFERLAGFSRLIVFDQRGTGCSDPVAISDMIQLEERSADIIAVLDAVSSERAFLFATTMAAPLACFFAATHGDRARGLILLDGVAKRATADEIEQDRPMLSNLAERWGTPDFGADNNPLLDQATREWFGYYRRMSMGPGAAEAMFRATIDLDVSNLLDAIHVPALVLHHPNNKLVDESHSSLLAARIPGARSVPLPSDSSSWMGPDRDQVLDLVEEFVTGQRPARPVDERVLATLLFTDVVSSTEHVARIGDRAWAALLARHDHIAQATIDRHRGSFVNSAGDGLLARFDGPARAIRCAMELRDQIARIGMRVRAGLHTGEVELVGDNVRGLAVHIGARVSAIATGDEVLVSSTVKDLVVGSGIDFEDRGTHTLKGVPDEWRIFAVTD